MTDALPVRRVLGGGPFAEIGEPLVSARSEAAGVVAVGGDLGDLEWAGRSTGDQRDRYRIGVYALGGLDLRSLLMSAHPVNALAPHPRLPLLAIGTGHFDDGGWADGSLVLLDLESGRAVTGLVGRYVCGLRWRGERVLEAVRRPWLDSPPETGPNRRRC